LSLLRREKEQKFAGVKPGCLRTSYKRAQIGSTRTDGAATIGVGTLGQGQEDTMGAGLLWGLSVLIVDDDDFTRSLIVMMLRKLQALKIHEARNGVDALKQTTGKIGGVDIVLADLNMPKMNGLELLKAVRTGQACVDRAVPFAILTGHSDTEYVSIAMYLDVDCFMIKPVTVEVLQDRLQRILTERQAVQDIDCYRMISVPAVSGAAGERPPAAAAPAKATAAPGRDPAARAAAPLPASHSTPSLTSATARPSAPSPGGVAAAKVVGCPLAKVPAEAVLARDVVLANGVTLLKAGQVLKPSLLNRLRDLADLDPGVRTLWLRS